MDLSIYLGSREDEGRVEARHFPKGPKYLPMGCLGFPY